MLAAALGAVRSSGSVAARLAGHPLCRGRGGYPMRRSLTETLHEDLIEPTDEYERLSSFLRPVHPSNRWQRWHRCGLRWCSSLILIYPPLW